MGLMGRISLMSRMSLMGLMGLMGVLWLLAACTSENVVEAGGETVSPERPERPEVRPSVPVEGVSGVVSEYREYEPGVFSPGATRAWIPPTDYDLYPDAERSISVYFAQNPDPTPPKYYEEEYFFRSNGKWRVSKTDLEATSPYYLYGYVPYDFYANVTATIEKLSGDGKTYADGAVLKLQNLPTATSDDWCGIIGAKNGKSDYKENEDYSVTGLVRGDFAYEAQPTTPGSGGTGNYVYLLLDHLYSAMRFRFRVDATYNALRTIKLKKLQLWTFTEPLVPGNPPVPNRLKSDVTVTLHATADGADPIQSITYVSSGDAYSYGDTECIFFESAEGLPLTDEWSASSMGHFAPEGVYRVILRSTYDVYDKKGNLVRENSTADNIIVLSEMDFLPPQTTAHRGVCYTIKLTIKPTYLYVMSDPDLDNPTVTVTK